MDLNSGNLLISKQVADPNKKKKIPYQEYVNVVTVGNFKCNCANGLKSFSDVHCSTGTFIHPQLFQRQAILF